MEQVKVERAKEIRKLYDTGEFTQKDLGVIFELLRETIGEIVRNEIWVDTGYIPRDLEKERNERNKKIIKLYKTKKYSQQEIADEIGVHRRTINRVTKEFREEQAQALQQLQL